MHAYRLQFWYRLPWLSTSRMRDPSCCSCTTKITPSWTSATPLAAPTYQCPQDTRGTPPQRSRPTSPTPSRPELVLLIEGSIDSVLEQLTDLALETVKKVFQTFVNFRERLPSVEHYRGMLWEVMEHYKIFWAANHPGINFKQPSLINQRRQSSVNSPRTKLMVISLMLHFFGASNIIYTHYGL